MIINFEEYNKREQELNAFKKQVMLVIDDFVLNTDFKKNHPLPDNYKNAKDFYWAYSSIPFMGNLMVEYYSTVGSMQHGGRLKLSNEEGLQLKEFMKDVELYKNAKTDK